MTRNHATFIT